MKEINYQLLCDRFVAGDDEAFRSLYLGLYPRLMVAARQIGNQAELAEEVVQDLFLWVWNNRDRLDRIDRIEEYLYRSTYRNMKQALQREHLRQSRLRDVGKLETTVPGEGKLGQLIARETEEAQRMAVARILNMLSPRQRQIIHLRFMEQKSYREISALLSITEQVCRNMAYRGLKKLRKSSDRLKLPLALLAVSWSIVWHMLA